MSTLDLEVKLKPSKIKTTIKFISIADDTQLNLIRFSSVKPSLFGLERRIHKIRGILPTDFMIFPYSFQVYEFPFCEVFVIISYKKDNPKLIKAL